MRYKCKKRRGGQIGNQNARKHGFYSSVLDKSEKHSLKQAAQIVGIDSEINLLRVKIRSIAEHDPKNVKLISQASLSLARLLKIRIILSKKDKDTTFSEAVEKALINVGIGVGINPLSYEELKFTRPALAEKYKDVLTQSMYDVEPLKQRRAELENNKP